MDSGSEAAESASFHPVDHNSAMPLYLQIISQVEAYLHTKRLKPKQMLPAESALCEQFDVSRKTLRRAMDHLAGLGLVRRIHGVGTTITEEAWVGGFSALRSIHHDLVSARRTPETKLLSAVFGFVDTAVSRSMGFPVGTEVVFLARLRLAEGRPHAILNNVVLGSIGPLDESDLTGSFLEVMRLRGLNSHIIHQEIAARLPTREQAALLDISSDTPILCETLQNVNVEGAVLNYSTNIYHPVNHRMSRVTFINDLRNADMVPAET